MSIQRKSVFTPTPTQEKFLTSTEKQVLLSGSFGAGKSRVGCEKGVIMNMKYPGNRGAIIRDTFTDVRASTIEQTLLEEVLPGDHIYDHNKSSHKILHKTGQRGPNNEPILSEIQYHGLDSGKSSDGLPTKIGGQQYGWIFVDEGIEISKGAWIQLLGRLRFNGRTVGGQKYKVPLRQIYTATNPASKTHWMYDWFFRQEKGEYYMMTAQELVDHVESVPNDYVETMAENFTGMYYDRYVEGKWVASQGLVYSEYDENIHRKSVRDLPGEWEVERRLEYGEYTSIHAKPPADWRVHRSIDFGFRNPFVCQFWATSPKGDTHVLFREVYITEELIEDVSERIKDLSKGLTVEQSYADPASAEDRATLERHGIQTVEAKKDIGNGVQEVKSKMAHEGEQENQIVFMEGSLAHQPDPDLDESSLPVKTVDEIADYQWDGDKEKPEKENDHGMDAMRYFIFTIAQESTWSKEEMERLEDMFNNQDF